MTDPLSLLERRATELAKPPPTEDLTPSVDLLEVTVAGRNVALESRMVRQILPNPGLCLLPRECGLLIGMVAARNAAVPVADLGALLGDSDSERDRPFVVLVDDPTPFGLLVDTVSAVRSRRIRDIRQRAATAPGIDIESGITPDGVVVLDVDVLIGDPRLDPVPDPDQQSVTAEVAQENHVPHDDR